MNSNRSNSLAWWSAATILVSAFLLFQVQPVISKKILPWFGGSPAVWTTCVLFFQLVLLGGYAYSHWLIRSVPPIRQGMIHVSLLCIALLTLLIGPRDWWKPSDGTLPALRILALLSVVVGAAYFSLSTTGPLVQAWFSQLYPGRSPYRLYALSNVGSLAALLTYPFLIERTLFVNTQWAMWSLGFAVFAGLIGTLAWIMRKEAGQLALAGVPQPDVTAADGLIVKRPAASAQLAERNSPEPAAPESPPSSKLRAAWLVLAALASMAFLAITNHLCQDIAVVPFMWVIPLSLYLLSFIICFDNERWYVRKVFGPLTILAILWLTAMQNYTLVNSGLSYIGVPYVQRVGAAILNPPKFDKEIPEQVKAAEEYAKKSFAEKVKEAKPYFDPPFSGAMDKVFDGVGWVVGKFDVVWQGIVKDRSPVVLENGDTFAKLDANKDGKLTNDELAEPAITTLVQWDVNSNGSVSEEEFNIRAGKRKAPSHLVFDVDTYDFKEHVFALSAAYMLVLFLICMVCHGELVKSKPQPKYLTSFYLSISAGGALGGLFVALICPLIFKTHFELFIAMIGGFLIGWLAIFNDGRRTWMKREVLQWALAFVLVATAFFVLKGNVEDVELQRIADLLPKAWQASLIKRHILPERDNELIAMERNFYGTVTVKKMGDEDDPENAGIALYNGRIWHGFQFTSPDRQLEPSTYYVAGTGAALAIQENPRATEPLRVAIIGLGSGSMAAHAKAGDMFRFYDIDPKVVDVAHKYFTYLAKSPAHPEVVLGDARISMERELKEQGPQNFDIIHLDAFSGDAIPAHLLTDESFALYEKHLRHEERIDEKTGKKIQVPVGIVVVHISNRYIDLEPVVAAIARKHGYTARTVHKTEDGGPVDTASDWVLVTKNEEFLKNPNVINASEPLKPDKEILWTDQFTALFPLMK